MDTEIIAVHELGDSELAVWFDGGAVRTYTAEELGVSAEQLHTAGIAQDYSRLLWGTEAGPVADELLGAGKECDLVSDEKRRLLKELAAIRRDAAFSQTRLGNAAGIRQSVISRIEGCEISPQINTLLKLLAPLGKTLEIVDIDNG